MFINQAIDSELTQLIQNKDWGDFCPDPNKYQTNQEYKKQYHTELYDRISTEGSDFINKILEPFYRNDYVVNLTTKKMSNTWCFDWNSPTFLFELEYDVLFSNDTKTNPFQCNLTIKGWKNGNTLKYEWLLKNPERIYIRKYLNSGNHINCNKLLFTNRGFISDGWQRYRFIKPLNEWTDINGFGDKICKHLKKTICDLKTDYEKIQKDISIKQAERSIQLDEILNMMEEINAKIKDTNLKLLIDGNVNFDYVDAPIKFELTLSNNPNQTDENLRIINDEDIIWGESWRTRQDLTDEELEKQKIKMFTWHYTSGSYSYRNHMNIDIVFKPDSNNYYMNFNGWNVDRTLFDKLFKCSTDKDFTNVESMRDYILNVILKDHDLYKNMEKWLNESN